MALVGVGVPLAYSLILATQAGGSPSGTWVAVLRNTAPAALLGIGAWYVARRLARHASSKVVVGHIVAAASYGFLWALTTYSGFGLWPDARGWSDFARYSLWWFVLFGGLLYGVIAGAAHVSVGKEILRGEREAALQAQSTAILAQLEALRARLDPHFLFNALHSLAILAREHPPLASKGLTDLAQLLRYVLDAGRGTGRDVALDDELAFISDYLALERLRLGDRLKVTTKVEDEARECGLPAFVLQPLVENAIRHAIAPRPSGGELLISAWVDGHRLVLEVADDGAGMTLGPHSGIGLRMVRQLLEVRYSGEATCELRRNAPSGVIATITLPAHPPTTAGSDGR